MTGSGPLPLGRPVSHPQRVDSGVLHALPRAPQRAALGLATAPVPFHGSDQWTAWELSWLEPGGRPAIAVLVLEVPADSAAMVESKSLKLYLNGYAYATFAGAEAVAARIAADVGDRCGGPVSVVLHLGAAVDALAVAPLAGECIDAAADRFDTQAAPEPGLLSVCAGSGALSECLHSRLFRSNCPVTGQPDWADVQVRYHGAAIDRAGLLRYLVSYRQHSDFHEHCVERMFVDIKARCRPDRLTVQARFTRRGGLDISPWRSDDPDAGAQGWTRTGRQ